MSGTVANELASQCALFFAVLLAASAIHKARRWESASAAARALVPAANGMVAAGLLGAACLAELCASVLLAASTITGAATRTPGAVLAAAVWSAYALFIAHALRQGRRDIACGCSFGGGHAPLGRYQLLRNAVLIALALLTASVPAGDGTAPVAALMLAALPLLALYGALDQVMSLRPLRAGVSR